MTAPLGSAPVQPCEPPERSGGEVPLLDRVQGRNPAEPLSRNHPLHFLLPGP